MIKKIIKSDAFGFICGYGLMIVLIIGLILLMINTDKKRCEARGGIFIWEWSSHGSKCHIIDREEEEIITETEDEEQIQKA